LQSAGDYKVAMVSGFTMISRETLLADYAELYESAKQRLAAEAELKQAMIRRLSLLDFANQDSSWSVASIGLVDNTIRLAGAEIYQSSADFLAVALQSVETSSTLLTDKYHLLDMITDDENDSEASKKSTVAQPVNALESKKLVKQSTKQASNRGKQVLEKTLVQPIPESVEQTEQHQKQQDTEAEKQIDSAVDSLQETLGWRGRLAQWLDSQILDPEQSVQGSNEALSESTDSNESEEDSQQQSNITEEKNGKE
jgi:hypothetical protein